MTHLSGPIRSILAPLGVPEFAGRVTLHGQDPLLASPHRIGEATASILAARAIAAANLWSVRNSETTDIDIRLVNAVHALHATNFIWLNGYRVDIDPTGVPVTGMFRCKDGRWIFTIAGPPYLKLLNGYLNFFDCGNSRASVAREIARRESGELEDALSSAGLPATIARSDAEWLAHPQGKALSGQPVVHLKRIADADASPLPRGGAAMEGMRVLDWSHVLAGPTASMELARAGADTLHVRSPQQLDPLVMALWGNRGKRSCFLDFARGSSSVRDMERMHELLDDADVFVYSWRPEVARRYGFDVESVLARPRRKGIVYVEINCYGWGGPWDLRGGFDHNGQMATGFAVSEGSIDQPRLSPVGYLNDLLTGHLAATGAMAALSRRATEGGSWHVRVSLAESAMWVQRLGLLDRATYINKPGVPDTDAFGVSLVKVDSVFGEVTYAADPIIYSSMPRLDVPGPIPFGANKPTWISRPAIGT